MTIVESPAREESSQTAANDGRHETPPKYVYPLMPYDPFSDLQSADYQAVLEESENHC